MALLLLIKFLAPEDDKHDEGLCCELLLLKALKLRLLFLFHPLLFGDDNDDDRDDAEDEQEKDGEGVTEGD